MRRGRVGRRRRDSHFDGLVAWWERVADDALDHGLGCFEQLGVDRVVDDAGGGSAVLARVVEGSRAQRFGQQFEVGVVEDNGRAVAGELVVDSLEGAGGEAGSIRIKGDTLMFFDLHTRELAPQTRLRTSLDVSNMTPLFRIRTSGYWRTGRCLAACRSSPIRFAHS